MAKTLHHLIKSAKTKAETYTVKRSPNGHRIWAFLGWDKGGWCQLDTFRTKEEAWVGVLDRLGLLEPEDRKPAQVPPPTVTWTFGGYDLGDWLEP